MGAPIRAGAYGDGSLPRVRARSTDAASLRLFNQSFWDIGSLDLGGGTTFGFYAGGDGRALQHLHLSNLLVHDVRGPLKRKDSGLVLISGSGAGETFDDIQLDGVAAYDTTQWSGIFVADASHVRIVNSSVHDVQGDGIIVFSSSHALIARSLAWHTGMQHQVSVGTPNAIWTWHCTDCTVEDNEAFLTDSPGVDGGSFDIDFGNIRNTVRNNFGHDTVGYCVAVFGAFGPTIDSVVSGNLCINNGMSPRLAQRQGAILLMTWQGGSLNGVQILGNRVDWEPMGDVPVVQSGSDLQAKSVTLRDNDIHFSTAALVDPNLTYNGERNHYLLVRSTPADEVAATKAFRALPEIGSTLTLAKLGDEENAVPVRITRNVGTWRLELDSPSPSGPQRDPQQAADIRGILVQLKSAALQYGHIGLMVTFAGDTSLSQLANDWLLSADGVSSKGAPSAATASLRIRLISPSGKVAHEWAKYPGPVELGLALRAALGTPNFSHLPMESIRATD